MARKIFMVVYGCMIAALLGVTIWGAFDVRHRIHIVMLAQAPVLLMRIPFLIFFKGKGEAQ